MKKNELGRSMVEMLGTLAVMGVLSVAGVAGYTYAMNKHKANEILANISRKLPGISTQMIQEVETVELEDEELFGALIALAAVDSPDDVPGGGEEQFAIRVEGPSSAICRHLVNAWEEQVADSKCDSENDEGNYVHYVFNYDLSPGQEAPVRNACKNVKCKSGKVCIGGACECPNSLTEDEKGDCLCTNYEIHECGDKYYCHISSWSCNPSTSKLTIKGGKCTLQSGNTYSSGTLSGISISSNKMSYWDAVNYCKSVGKTVISETDAEKFSKDLLAKVTSFWVASDSENCRKVAWNASGRNLDQHAGSSYHAVCN